MKNLLLATLMIFTLPLSANAAGSLEFFQAFWEVSAHTSLEDDLAAFKGACHPANSIDFETGIARQLVKKSLMRLSTNQIRALIYAEKNCASAASFEALHQLLGNEILLHHPAKLIEAIHLEKRNDLGRIVEEEINGELSSECETNQCIKQRKAFFARKRAALSRAKINVAFAPVRNSLLKNLTSDL